MTGCYSVEVSEGECGSSDVSGGLENVAVLMSLWGVSACEAESYFLSCW